MEKSEIRKYIKQQKSQLTSDYKSKASCDAFEVLERTQLFKEAQKILLYYSLPDEISTVAFIEKWSNKKEIFLPRVNGNSLDILPYSSDSLFVGAFNIQEPIGTDEIDINDLDLVIVPAVAYDVKGNRVGRGKGYYDRLLENSAIKKIGIVYDFQLLPMVKAFHHDQPVDMIITDRRIVFVNQ